MAALPIFGRLLGTTKIPPKRGVCKALLKRIMRLSVSCAAFAGNNLTTGNRRRRPFHRRMERCACGSEHPLEHIDGRQSEHCVPRDDPRIDLNRSTELAGDVIHCPRSSRAFSVSLARTLLPDVDSTNPVESTCAFLPISRPLVAINRSNFSSYVANFLNVACPYHDSILARLASQASL